MKATELSISKRKILYERFAFQAEKRVVTYAKGSRPTRRCPLRGCIQTLHQDAAADMKKWWTKCRGK